MAENRLLHPALAEGVIFSVPSVYVSVCICRTYVVHHFVSTELLCAPSTCVVHPWPALCTMLLHSCMLRYEPPPRWCTMWCCQFSWVFFLFFLECSLIPAMGTLDKKLHVHFMSHERGFLAVFEETNEGNCLFIVVISGSNNTSLFCQSCGLELLV